MKKLTIISVIILFVLVQLAATGAETSQKNWLKRIYRMVGQKKYLEAFQAVEQGLTVFGSSNELLQLKYNILVKLKRYDEASAFLDNEIKKSGESEELLSAKYDLLFLQGKLVEALKVAMEKDKITKIKSPWDAINIMHVYMRMASKIEALDWLQEAVTRGFISYRILDDRKYEIFKQDKRFYDIIENIKSIIGLGYPAKNFTTKLISGNEFTLAKQQGKVVLIYFWAYWCEPCKKEMPYLDNLYRKYKDKDLEIVGINLDSSKQKMEAFIKEKQLQWKHACSGKVWKDETAVLYGVNSLPSLWVIDKKGILRSFDVKGDELQKVIDALLSDQ